MAYLSQSMHRPNLDLVGEVHGRTVEAKKQLINLLFERLNRELNLSPQDVEITIFETPQHNWGGGDCQEMSYP